MEGEYKMKVEVLLSCMHQTDFSITNRMNLTTDILIVNQCDENKYEERMINGKKQRMIYTTQRGLSQSRNELLNNMEGDIGIFCDDDVVYEKNYEEIVKKVYSKLPDADIIAFNIKTINAIESLPIIKKTRKSPKHKNYCSVRLTFKKESFIKNNIWFNKAFGTGAKYYSGEESLLLREANNKKLKLYETQEYIATVDFSESTWFKGYDQKFFFVKGAWLKAAYPKAYFIFKWYYILKFGDKKIKKMSKINRWLIEGIKDYKKWYIY